jgi:hypothetical protein
MPSHPVRTGNSWAIVLLTVAFATAGCGNFAAADSAPEPSTSVEEPAAMKSSPGLGGTALVCGQPFPTPTEKGLTFVGRFPATATVAERRLTGTVALTSQVRLRGMATPRADLFLVRSGRVATLPVPQDLVGVLWDLSPGDAISIPGEATLISCDAGAAPLPPGGYQLFARVVVVPDQGDRAEFFGGPWSVDLR